MKIAIITRFFGEPLNEGVKKLAHNLVGHLEGRGDEVWVITPSPAKGERVKSQSNYGSSFEKYSFLKFAVDSLREIKPDVVFFFVAYSFSLGIKTLLLKKLTGLPLVVYVGATGPLKGFAKIFLSANRVVAYDAHIERYLPGSEVVLPFINPDGLKPRPKDWSGKKIVFFIGGFQKDRGVEHLVRAVAALREKHDIKLVLAWNGYGDAERSIRTEIARYGLEEHTEIHGNVDINEAYNRAHIVVVPRLSDRFMTFPLRFMECFHMRTPLVVTDVCMFREYLRGAGLVVPPGSSQALTCAIERLLTDRELYDECVRKCGEAAEAYSAEKSLKRLREILVEAAGTR